MNLDKLDAILTLKQAEDRLFKILETNPATVLATMGVATDIMMSAWEVRWIRMKLEKDKEQP